MNTDNNAIRKVEDDEEGLIVYYKGDQFHREDGPAVVRYNGTKEWWINGQRHREDGPAIEYADGGYEYFLNGKCHKLDGPAVSSSLGAKFWFINGTQLTNDEARHLRSKISLHNKLQSLPHKHHEKKNKI